MRASTEAETRHDRIDTSRPLNLTVALQQERFDALTRLARHLFKVPVAMVTLLDAQHEAHPGDAPILVDGLRMGFHAACPLTASSGSQLGALRLFDAVSRQLDQAERALLQDFADMAVAIIE